MNTLDDLDHDLHRIDGRGYPAYKDIQGYTYSGYDGSFELRIDHVQGDPFAAPSRIRFRIAHESTNFPDWCHSSESRRIALENYLTRMVSKACHKISTRAGSGKSGLIDIDTPGQEVIARTALLYKEDSIEVRLRLGLPARGRRIAGREATRILCDHLPQMAFDTLKFELLAKDELLKAVETNEDADALRDQLKERQLVAFIENGAVLPRRSGINQEPLKSKATVPFQSPSSLELTLNTPNHGPVTGLGIPKGITLIVGGGFHGKSTLLNALERGVYNHRPGDGREFVVSRSDTVKIRSEDGRSVSGVDISPFINNLPNGADTADFSTENASGSTSQASNIMEALESGADNLLIDEDIAATNFMIRDHRMQELVSSEKEPITPFIAKVRSLYRDHGVSSILVIGGTGDYFSVADRVICMDHYLPQDLTQEAKNIAKKHCQQSLEESETFGSLQLRRPQPESINPRKGRREVSVKTRNTHHIQFGENDIELDAVSQLVSSSQTRAIGAALAYAVEKNIIDGNTHIAEILDLVCGEIEAEGFDALTDIPQGDLAGFRRHEFAAALNRLRSLNAVAG